MSAYHDGEFCRRCGRPYEDHESDGLYVDVDLNDATEYIFGELLDDGIVVDRLDIVSLLQLFLEYVEAMQDS
jgi:hypothetical protein